MKDATSFKLWCQDALSMPGRTCRHGKGTGCRVSLQELAGVGARDAETPSASLERPADTGWAGDAKEPSNSWTADTGWAVDAGVSLQELAGVGERVARTPLAGSEEPANTGGRGAREPSASPESGVGCAWQANRKRLSVCEAPVLGGSGCR